MKTIFKNKKCFCITVLLDFILLLCSSCNNTNPVLKVITQDESNNTAEYDYWIIYSNGEVKETDEFNADYAEFYTTDYGCFTSKIENGKVVNTLENVTLLNENDEEIEADEIMISILEAAAKQIPHAIMQLTIVKDNNDYFAFVKLNVNLWDPSNLYQYDAENGTLTLLHSWDHVKLIGITLSEA